MRVVIPFNIMAVTFSRYPKHSFDTNMKMLCRVSFAFQWLKQGQAYGKATGKDTQTHTEKETESERPTK